jgi:hypothetical protein
MAAGTPDMTTKPDWIDLIVPVGSGNGKREAIRVSEIWVWSANISHLESIQ